MARTKKNADADAGEAEAQDRADTAAETGTIGAPVDPIPNEAYSQETDPTSSPGPVDAMAASAMAGLGAQAASGAELHPATAEALEGAGDSE